ncbi:MAG: hypothetical protein OIF48_12060 [Silicimonas sp.]|nr:hypothetical protein [Silicimonas sp.]
MSIKDGAAALLKRIWYVIASTYHALAVLKIQLFVALATVVLLTQPPQILEIYQILLDDFANRWLQVVLALLGLGMFTFMQWYSGRLITLKVEPDMLHGASLRSQLLRILPRFLAVLPVLGVALVLILPSPALEEMGNTSLWRLRVAGGLVLVMQIAALLLMIYRTQMFGTAGVYEPGKRAFSSRVIGLFTALPIVLFLALLLSPVALPQALGTLFFTTIFLSVLVFALSGASLFSRRTGFPLTFFVLGWGILLSFVPAHDNHRVRTAPVPEGHRTVAISEAFAGWLEARRAVTPDGAPFPVYVIAAEGGGIYAAHHAASFLARLHDLCPGFSNHVFAISGISGGSVGASLFSALLEAPEFKADLPPVDGAITCAPKDLPGPMEQKVEEILSQDLLSPLVAATLFKDIPQRIFPIPFESLDRARALEDAIASAWEKAGLDAADLTAPLVTAWSADGKRPALVLNTTRVSTGERVIAAPFSVPLSDAPMPRTRDFLNDTEGLSLLSAGVLSARFTYITPAGTLSSDTKPIARLVDGGYFENSGIDTAMDMIEAIRSVAQHRGAEIRLISLQYDSEVQAGSLALNESLAPIRTLLTTRVNRGVLAERRAATRMTGFCRAAGGARCASDARGPLRVSRLTDAEGTLPLGWLLSRRTSARIRAEIGQPAGCDAKNPPANDCLMQTLVRELSGDGAAF